MLPDPPRQRVRLDWIGFLSPSRGDLLRAAGAVARPAARLVRIAGDLARDDRRGLRLLHLRGAQPDERSSRSSTCACCSTAITRSASSLVGVYRHAELDPDGAAAAASCSSMPGFPTRSSAKFWRRAASARRSGFFVAMFIGRLDPRIGMSIGFGLQVISGLWLMSINLDVGMDDPGGQQHAAGHCDRRHLGAADDRQLRDAGEPASGPRRWRCSI